MEAVAAVPEKPVVRISAPTEPDTTGPCLVRGGREIYRGMTEDALFDAAPRPRNAFDFYEEVPITGEPYVAKGWQSGAESIGVLSLRGRVVLALWTIDNPGQEEIGEILNAHVQARPNLEKEIIPGELGSYWFWQQGKTRLMILQTKDAKKQTNFTACIGDAEIMDALHMNVEHARRDLLEAKTKLDALKDDARQ